MVERKNVLCDLFSSKGLLDVFTISSPHAISNLFLYPFSMYNY